MDISVQQHILPIVVIVIMATVGMELRIAQFDALFKSPRLPIIGSLIHTFCFPVTTVLVLVFIRTVGWPLSDAAAIGMLLIAACPSGGFSNVMALIARVNLPLSVLLTSISSILSFATVPLMMGLFSFLISDLDQPIRLPVLDTLIQLLVLILIPIGAGMLVRIWLDEWVDAHLQRIQKGGQFVLYVTIFFLFLESWDTLAAGFSEALPWSILLCGLNLFLCYQVSSWIGLGIEDRVTVALEGSIRNLAVALLIAANVLGRMDIAVFPSVYFVAVMIIAVVFANVWRKILRV